MTVRVARREDLGRIAAIYGYHVLNSVATFEIYPPTEAVIVERWAHLSDAGMPYLVAENERGIVGYAYASQYRPRPAYRFTVEDSVYLDPEAQGQGYGTALLMALIDACMERGFRQMVAVIGGSENVASVRLHAKCGFREVGVLRNVGFKFDAWQDTVLMQRSLGNG